MAGLTRRDRMKPEKRESRQFVIEQDSSRKRIFIVAFRTILPKILLMHVIRPMTAVTVGRHVVLFHFSSMTTVTGIFLVGATERKITLLGMIEFRRLPLRGRMAGPALFAESTRMDVIARMATGAGLGKLSFTRRQLMTSCAARFTVCTRQREATFALVIEALFEPGVCFVAIRTARTELAFVYIVDGMTGDAITRRRLVVLRDMTSIAARVDMSPRQ